MAFVKVNTFTFHCDSANTINQAIIGIFEEEEYINTDLIYSIKKQVQTRILTEGRKKERVPFEYYRLSFAGAERFVDVDNMYKLFEAMGIAHDQL